MGSDSDVEESQIRRDSFQIAWIAGDYGLPRSSSADRDVGIDNIGCMRLREQQADSRRVRSVERHQVRAALPDQPRQANLPRGISNSLRERSRWYCDPQAEFRNTRE